MSIRDMVDSIMTEEEGEEMAAEGTASDDNLGGDDLGGEFGGDDLGGDDGGDDLGGLGGLDDDDEDLGGLDDGGFDDMDGGEEMAATGNVDELEHRLDELENEVGSLSSTVNTVRNENEQISESVEEVEENVRKLLDIYEMVTRGVNPFADEVDPGMGGMDGEMEGEGSFGLFTDEEDDSGGEGVDEDITDADAEGFFDDDLVEDEEEEFGGDESLDDDGGGGGGTSFEELKDEYESGDADWDEGDEEFGDEQGDEEFDEFGDDLEDDEFGDDLADEEFDDDLADEEAQEDEEFDEFGDDLEDDDLFEDEATPEETGGADGGAGAALETPEREETGDEQVAADPAQQTSTATPPTSTQRTGSSGAGTSGKPYIAALPQGFAADLILVEWLEFLVGQAGIHETSKALDYYESVGWISEDVADEMNSYLRGFNDRSRGRLTIDHHKQSLDYINQLNGGVSVQQPTDTLGQR